MNWKLVLQLVRGSVPSVLFAALFALGAGAAASAQSHGGGGGHGAGMAREDPVLFIRDIEKAAGDVLTQLKAGKTMDARSSISRLNAAAGKLNAHITNAALQKRLTGLVNDIKTIAAAKSPSLFDLEDKLEALRPLLAEVRETVQGMEGK